MTIERLTAADRWMLWPDATWPQDIAVLAIVDGRRLLAGDGQLRLDAVSAAVAGRVHLVPRLRQVLHVPGPRLGGPLWADAPAFDLADHLHVMPLPTPGNEDQLLRAVESVRRQRLDRTRPMWGMWFFTGLPEGRIGLLMRAHHSMVDGMAGVATLGLFLDVDPDAVRAPAKSWKPSSWPSEAELLADERRRRGVARHGALSSISHPVRSFNRIRQVWPSVTGMLFGKPPPATSLDRMVGPDRSFALVRERLDAVKAVAHANGAKVNDVLLALIGGGLHDLLSSRGELRDGLVVRVSVPVTLRNRGAVETAGNQIAEMAVAVPVGVADAVERLHRIAADAARQKGRPRPSLGQIPHSGLAGGAFLRLLIRQRINVTSADLPGPSMPLYIAGARLLEVFPVIPLIGNVPLGVGAISYAGQFNLTLVADSRAFPDLDVVAAGIRNAMSALTASLFATQVA